MPISGRDKICVTDKNVVYNVTAVPGSTFHWTVAAAVGTKTFDFNANAILIDAAAVAGSGNITVYETNSYVCNGDTSFLPVQVYSVPAPENISWSGHSLCQQHPGLQCNEPGWFNLQLDNSRRISNCWKSICKLDNTDLCQCRRYNIGT